MTKKKNKRSDILFLLMVLTSIVLINVISSFIFKRIDLTSEKRYTLSQPTKELIKKLDDVVYVKVYLEGEFPAGFKRLRNETQLLLDELRTLSNQNIEYEFINPIENKNKKQQNEIFRQLYEKGLKPTNLEVKDETGKSQQIIFPGALITYKGKELPLQLLKTQLNVSPDVALNNSIQALEYGFANTIQKLMLSKKPKIAFLDGHGELDTLHVADITYSLKDYYDLSRVTLDEQLNILTQRDSISPGIYRVNNKYDAIVIAQPDSSFSEKNKFIIDQFIMNGGNVFWLLDFVYTDTDSLGMRGYTYGLANSMNLEDQLFKYGVRINADLIQDLYCASLPINKALRGATPRFELEPWFYYPLIATENRHPIVKNLDVIKCAFVSTIDTVSVQDVKKTILLTSSKLSNVINAPVHVDLRMVNIKPDEKKFKKSFQPVAVLLEGTFESLYKNRLANLFEKNKSISFKEKSKPVKMIVVSDGDVIKNEISKSKKTFYELGFDRASNQTFGNKNFILNCIDYLCDDSGLLSIRSREVKLRMLDKKKIKNQRLKWQLVNTLIPIGFISGIGIILYLFRKRKYSL